jgi:hypothetical protein
MTERKNYVVWSIHSDTSPKDVDSWVKANSVGFSTGNGCGIPVLEDGSYTVKQRKYWKNGEYNPNAGFAKVKTKVSVAAGKISVEDCLNALDEFISLTGEHHYFLESVLHDKSSNTISFLLGS